MMYSGQSPSDSTGQESIEKPTPTPVDAKQEIKSFLKTLVVLIVLAIILRGSVIEAFKIPSGSMIPTLRRGDHILVSKLSYGIWLPFTKVTIFQFSAPRRGDIVVFTRPDLPSTLEDESDINIIKRVIGLPGDLVEVRGPTAFVNGQALEEPYAQWQAGGSPDGHFYKTQVPEGKIFLLGDNRDYSKDSRFWEDPFLPIERVKGRALVIYFSWHDIFRFGTLIR